MSVTRVICYVAEPEWADENDRLTARSSPTSTRWSQKASGTRACGSRTAWRSFTSWRQGGEPAARGGGFCTACVRWATTASPGPVS